MVLDLINPYILIGIAVVLIGLEAVITSFILIWFGLGFLIVGLISFGYEFSDGLWQLGAVALISLAFLVLLRKKALEKFLKSDKDISDNFLNEKGIGEVKNSKIFYKATYWEVEFASQEFDLEEGQKVEVLKTYRNFAVIEEK